MEELFRTTPPPNTSTKALKAERAFRRLKQPTPNTAETLVDQTKPGLGERQGDSLDQPIILDDEPDEAGAGDGAEGASGDVDAGRIGRDASPHNTLATSELASGPTESINALGPWFDVKEGCYVEEPALRLGSCEQQGIISALVQDQPQTLQSS